MNGFKRCDSGHFYKEELLGCPYCGFNDQISNELKEARKTNYKPVYDQLFFHLAGFYNPQGNELTEIVSKYDQYDYILFPLTFDHLQMDHPLFDVGSRNGLEGEKVGLFIFDVMDRFDPPHELNSNTTFSYISKNYEASGSIMSQLLNLPIDGENKLILVDKKDVFTIRSVSISNFEKPLTLSSLFKSSFQEAKLEDPIYTVLAQYLSLDWKQFDSEVKKDLSILKVEAYFNYLNEELPWSSFYKTVQSEWSTIKEVYRSAMYIRDSLYNKYKKIDPAIISLFQLAELKTRKILKITELLENIEDNRSYSMTTPFSPSDRTLNKTSKRYFMSAIDGLIDDGESQMIGLFKVEKEKQKEELTKIILTEEIETLVERFPNFNLDELSELKKREIEKQINSLIELEGLDYESLIFVKTAIALYSSLEDIVDENFDYSPFVLSYSKFIEKEINLSLVQLIRKKLGVTMPEFYNKYCTLEGDYFVYVREDFKVNFNMMNKRSGNYLPPGLGQNINALKYKAEEYNLNKEVVEELFSTGKKLNDYRNRSAHSELLNKEDLEQVRYFVSLLKHKNVFNELIKTKIDILEKNMDSI